MAKKTKQQKKDPNEPKYFSESYDDDRSEDDQKSVKETDLDWIAQQEEEDEKKQRPQKDEDEDITFEEDKGYDWEDEVLDEDSDNPPAGTPGHGGVDEGTS